VAVLGFPDRSLQIALAQDGSYIDQRSGERGDGNASATCRVRDGQRRGAVEEDS